MNTFRNLIQSFKKRPDLWFFYMFLLSFPLSIRKIIYTVPVNGKFSEFTSASIFLSDIFLFLTLLSYFFVLYNNTSILSNNNITDSSTGKVKIVPPQYKCSTPVKMFHVEHLTGQAWNILRGRRGIFLKFYFSLGFNKLFAQVIHNKVVILWLIIGLLSLLSTLWSQDKYLALFRSVKIFEFIFLLIYVSLNVPRPPRQASSETGGTFLKNSLKLIIISAIINSFVGILQFINKGSLGLFWLKESNFSTETLNTAKILLNSDMYIRAYGLFPHPNIFGGFLVFSIILTLAYFKLFHACPVKCSTWNIFTGVEQFSKDTGNCSTWNNFFNNKNLKWLILIVLHLALILTFSKSAILSLLLALIYINVPRGTFLLGWNIFTGMEHLKIFIKKYFYNKKIILYSLIVILIFVSINSLKLNYSSVIQRSLSDRLSFINVSRGTLIENPVIGIGSGQNVISLITKKGIMDWQYEPIHNVFLLIWLELGIFSLVLFATILYLLIRHNNVTRQIHQMFNAIPANCSTPTPSSVPRVPRQMFHVEHLYWGRTFLSRWNIFYVLNNFYRGGKIIQDSLPANEKKSIYFVHMKAILVAFIVIMLFDHYLWDIQQGQILFFIVMGIILSVKQYK